ncbi:hypothetical protein SteCoe_22956 [Stentor coeruleus]|uniref:Cilia- and flagella-associated protein 157 n=1 Tax=Stentor coeruleus TaxID=5963 RepID=A0A1R2BKW7_9CILI|nr:hypothetical protein SteCoe_22956 [Stentor coeruleus]
MDEKLPPSLLVEANPDHYLNRDREIISKLNERIEKMKAENYKLQKELKESKEDHARMSDYMNDGLDKKAQEIARLELEKAELEERYNRERDQNLEDHREKLNSIKEEKDREIMTLNRSIKEIEIEYKKIQYFKENKDAMEKELDDLKKEKEELSRKLTDQQTLSEQAYKKREEKLMQQYAEEIRKIEIDAESKARNKLSLEEQDLHKDNIRLISDMKLQRKEVEDIKNDKKKILEENRKLRQELEISQAQVKDCATKQSEMQKTIKMVKEKIRNTENEMSQMSSDFEKEKEMFINKFNAQFQDKEAELKNLKEQVKIRSKELKSMKALAQMILDQRSDVEQFFLESLEQIKEEVQKRIIAEGKTKKLPLINQKGKVYSDKVELSDLDWEDRERVLRLLFSKMNMGVPPTNWR